MTTHQNPGTPPDAEADRAPLHRGRRRPAVRWIAHGVLFVALAVGIFGLLPRLGGDGVEVLREAGLTDAEIDRLRSEKALIVP